MKPAVLRAVCSLVLACLTVGSAAAGTRHVTSTADSGPGTLRAAIAAAGAGDTIDFQLRSRSSITLASPLAIDKDLIIQGPGAPFLALDGDGLTGILNVSGGAAVQVSGLTLRNGQVHLGAALRVQDGVVAVTHCAFVANRAGNGGAIGVLAGTLDVVDCTFHGNQAHLAWGWGGAIVCDEQAALTVTGCRFTRNSASEGGAIRNAGTGVVTNCVFADNRAGYGGAAATWSPLTMVNCVFAGNRAGGSGGGLAVFGPTAQTVNCTFSGNVAGYRGGAIWTGFDWSSGLRQIEVVNCVVWGNGALQQAGIYNALPRWLSVSYSDVEGGWPGTGNFDADPLFVRSPFAGGPADYGDLHLSSGSPAIGSGSNAVVTVPPFPVDDQETPLDLDSNPRIVGAYVDMGAYEFASSGAPSSLAFRVQPRGAIRGTAMTPPVQVVVRDAGGSPVVTSGNVVTLSLGANPGGGALSGGVSAATVAGVATFPNLRISEPGDGYTLVASAPGLASATSAAFSISAAPATLRFTVQPSDTVAGTYMAPVQVTVLDAAGRTVIGAIAPITLAMGANPSGASLEPGSATVVPTNGVATFTRYLRLFRFTEGNHTLTASSTGLPTVTSTPFVYLAAAPAQTKFITQPANGTAGQVLTPPVQVAIQDVHGNVVRSATATVTLSLLTNPAGGVLTGTRILTTTNGVATFTDLKLNKAGSGYRILAGSLLLTRSSTAEFSIAPGPADRLGFSVAPSTTAAGAAITPAVQVQVRDAFGNRVPGATNAVSMRIGTNPGGGSLSGTTLVSAVDGVATFPNLAISQPGIGYTLWATSTDLKLGRSPAFTVSAAVP